MVRRRALPSPAVAAMVAVLLLVSGLPQALAAFSALTSNSGNAFGANATFKTYPQAVAGDSPAFHHRTDDSAAFGPTAVAADATAFNRRGTYAGATDGPVTSWQFNEGSGSTAIDSSGGANPGTLTNGTGYSNGPTSGSVTLDGTDDYVQGAHAAVRTDSSFSVSAWVWLNANSGVRTAVSQDGTTVSAFFLKANSYANRWAFDLPGGDMTSGAPNPSVTVNSSDPPTVQEWVHLVGVYDDAADQARLYVDGVLSGSAARAADWHASGSFAAGRGLWGSVAVDRWTGGLDDVRAYPRALTAVEVASMYATPATQWDFDETSGTSTADVSGNRNTGTLTGGAGWVTGRAGNAVSLDGVDDHVTGSASVPRTSRSFTVAAWVYLTNTTGNRTVYSQAGTASSAFILRHEASKWAFVSTNSDVGAPTTQYAYSTTVPVANTWVHLVGVYDDPVDQIRLYVNGKLEATQSKFTEWSPGGGATTVGRARWNSVDTDYWAGRIDGFRAYPQALTTTDIGQLYRDPALRYDFEDPTGTTVTDGSGNDNTGTLSAAAARTSIGYDGAAGSFNGTSEFLTSDTQAVATDASFTVAAWVYLTAAGTYRTAVSQDGTTVSAFYLQYHFGANRWAFNLPPSDGLVAGTWSQSTSVPALNRWTHLVGVYDDPNDQIRLYVNGVLEDSDARSAEWAATGKAVVGAAKYNGARADHWPGRVDRVEFFAGALSAADVAELHREDPSAAYTYEEGSGGTTADVSGHGNTATLTNAGFAGAGNGYWGSNGMGLNGTSAYVTSATSAVATDTSFTVAAWVYFNSKTVTRTVLSQAGSATSAFLLRYNQPTDRWQFVMTRSNVAAPTLDVAEATTSPSVNAWYHLVGVYDALTQRARLYVNGVEAGSVGHTSVWNATGGLTVGRAWLNSAGADYFAGTVDNVRTYQRALVPVEAARLPDYHLATVVPAVSHAPTMSAGVIGALQGTQQGQTASDAVAFNGAGASASNDLQVANPTLFTIEFWFRASGTAGGVLMGFYGNRTGLSGSRDRQVYLDSGGRLTVGTYPGASPLTVRTDAAYNDGAWHHVAASLGPAGLKLHVDGVLLKRDASITTAGAFSGYWRWGSGDTGNWPNRPTNDAFTGSIDEVAVYYSQLTDQQVAWHYHANH